VQFSGMTIFPLGAPGKGAGGRPDASSCNAAQLPRFLVYLFIYNQIVHSVHNIKNVNKKLHSS